jgi:ABC-2 type transport system ATP-binding protein
VIKADKLSKRFGDHLALASLDLDVAEGEVFGLLGPNGAGKTTALRLLTGLIAPTSGRAEIAGVPVTENADGVRARIGLLTETPGLYVRMDAIENLMFYARLYDVRDPMAKIESLLKRLGLWERREEAAGAFSKGMRQKLALARALLHDPKVVFLDEPTSALDPASAKVVRELVSELKREGRTIVLCTHNLDEADRLSDRVGVLRRGRLVHVGTPRELRHRLYGHATEVRVVGEASLYLDAVRALGFAGEATAEGSALRVAIERPEEQNPALVRALVTAGASVLSVTEENRALEDVYLDLMADDAQDAAAARGGATP